MGTGATFLSSPFVSLPFLSLPSAKNGGHRSSAFVGGQERPSAMKQPIIADATQTPEDHGTIT
ncbi:hypothetical protein HMPREF3121_09245 [Corynebacterium sp. HMSC11E11]|nr:hypothetical protein HMPREF3121_09245 [Corynebacterium sp. HMSC11E11]